MQVRLVSHSVPTETFRIEGIEDTQDLVAFCARVSNPGNQNNKKTADKLVQYLIKNNHWSPLEMASACLEITTTRDIARQILRHRSFSFQLPCSVELPSKRFGGHSRCKEGSGLRTNQHRFAK